VGNQGYPSEAASGNYAIDQPKTPRALAASLNPKERNANSPGEVAASQRAGRVSNRMQSRHLELLRSLSEKNRDKEEQQRKEDQRRNRRATLLRDRLVGPKQAGATASSSSTAPVVTDAEKSEATAETAEERKQRQAKANADIERRQTEALQSLATAKQAEKINKQRADLKKQWKAHKAKQYLVEKCQDVQLREFLEKQKPSALPKIPVRQNSCTPTLGTPASDGDRTPGGRPRSSSRGPGVRSASADPRCGVKEHVAESERQEKMTVLVPDGDANVPSASPVAVSRSSSKRGRPPLPHDVEEDSGAKEGNEVQLVDGSAMASDLKGIASGADTTDVAEVKTDKDKKGSTKELSAGCKASVGKFLERARVANASAKCADLDTWKRRNHCPADKKVFVCSGGYPDFRDALLNRGWFQNSDKDSLHFDCKWGMASNINHEKLKEGQVVNHFDRCRDLTTKNGLTANLRNSEWMSGVPESDYYPRAYDLYDPLERAEFVLDFKLTKAESVLRRLLEHHEQNAENTFSMDVVNLCNKICNRMVLDVDEVIDCPEIAETLCNLAPGEWPVLKQVNLDDVMEPLKGPTKKELDEMLNKRTTSTIRGPAKSDVEAEKDKPKKKKKKEADEETELNAPLSSWDCARGTYFLNQAREVLQELKDKNKQHCMHGGRNAWIVKPSGKSRGRGIQVMRELDEIFAATESDGFQWICQKYIENPQVPCGYKFDIRQWVLVTDWNPLTVYIWKQPYLRFAGKKYDETCTDRSEFVHLVNNSIIKNMDGFQEKNDELDACGYMWFRQQYADWMHKRYCKCDRHKTPFLSPPPYTCETYGVRWEDVAFTAGDEEDDDGDEAMPILPPGAAVPQNGREKPNETAAAVSTSTSAGSSTPSSASAASDEAAKANANDAEAGNTASSSDRSADCEERAGTTEPDDEDRPECVDHWEAYLRPQMKDIINWSLRCVVDQVQHRKQSFELYGYDFMVSEENGEPKVWLIEVNSSPACDYSTPVTCPLVKKMMDDTAKIIVDRLADPTCDVGEWELMEHENTKAVAQRACNHGDKLEVLGKKMKPPKGWKKKKKKKAKAKQHEANDDDDDDEDGVDDDGDGEDKDGEDDEDDDGED